MIQQGQLIYYNDINNIKKQVDSLFIPTDTTLSFIPNITFNINPNRQFTMKKYPIFGYVYYLTQTFDNGSPPNSSIFTDTLTQTSSQFIIPIRNMPTFFEYNIMPGNLTLIFAYDFISTFGRTVDVEVELGYNDGWCYIHSMDINNNISLNYSRQYQYNPNVYISLSNIKKLYITITNNDGSWGLVQQLNIKNINY